jgi:hypothetical protein
MKTPINPKWQRRRDSSMPYQHWCPYPDNAIVQVRSAYFPDVPDNIGPAGSFWWGYDVDLGDIAEGVIVASRRLDRKKLVV